MGKQITAVGAGSQTRASAGADASQVEWVVEVTHNRLSIRFDAAELDRLPSYRTDEEIDRDVGRALSNDEDLRVWAGC